MKRGDTRSLCRRAFLSKHLPSNGDGRSGNLKTINRNQQYGVHRRMSYRNKVAYTR